MADPRIFYDHLPYKYFKSIGKPNSKYVYVARNPKEVAISTYNFLTTKKHGGLLFGFNESWDQFFESFIKGETYYGSWLEHVSEWWRHRNDENVLFIWYEELLNDLPGSIKRIAEFLEQPVSEKLKQEICEKASFEAMKSDKDVKVADFLLLPPSAFFRAGTNKSWKDVFTKEQNSKMDKLLMAAKHVLNWNIDFS
uniref:Sulfotransferase domain-containing protein n=1 Tax=Acrobeloides nanus TaxID=290746 RepID=A0A914EIZ3_9BILA